MFILLHISALSMSCKTFMIFGDYQPVFVISYQPVFVIIYQPVLVIAYDHAMFYNQSLFPKCLIPFQNLIHKNVRHIFINRGVFRTLQNIYMLGFYGKICAQAVNNTLTLSEGSYFIKYTLFYINNAFSQLSLSGAKLFNEWKLKCCSIFDYIQT